MPKWDWQYDEQGNKRPVPFEDGLKALFPLPGWKIFLSALALASLGAFGTTIAYHRGLAHRALKLNPIVEQFLAALLRRKEFAAFETFHFAGHALSRGEDMSEAICDAVGLPYSRIGSFPWLALWALAPFVTVFREMLEMRYLWQREVMLDNRKLVAVLGAEPHTDLRDAVHDTLEALGCMEPVRHRVMA
jgi:hypothetical protein